MNQHTPLSNVKKATPNQQGIFYTWLKMMSIEDGALTRRANDSLVVPLGWKCSWAEQWVCVNKQGICSSMDSEGLTLCLLVIHALEALKNGQFIPYPTLKIINSCIGLTLGGATSTPWMGMLLVPLHFFILYFRIWTLMKAPWL